jgi:type IV secretion system protein VirB10
MGFFSFNCRTLLVLGATSLGAADPDFSGVWHLDVAGSEIQRSAQAPAGVLKLRHNGTAVDCEAVRDSSSERCSYTIDRKESRHETAGTTRSSVAKWEGDTIVVNTIVMKKNGGQHTEMDRWTLSRDQNTLRIRRQIVSLQDQEELLLVYRREGAGPAIEAKSQDGLSTRPAAVADTSRSYVVEKGSKIPLATINSVSTRNSAPGDRVYLQTVFPVLVDGRIVIPPGSFVNGTVTDVKRPGRVKGRGELYVRFDSLILPNGTIRDFRARVGSLDGRASEDIEREEGKIRSEGNKTGDARTVGETAAAGASIGVMAGSVAGRAGMGAGIGGAAGAAAGLAGVLLTRGPDAQLAAGSVVEMVLDRDLLYAAEELERPAVPQGQMVMPGAGPAPSVKQQRQGVPIPGRRLPY